MSGISIRGGRRSDGCDFAVGGTVLEELDDDLVDFDGSSLEVRVFWFFAAGPDGPAHALGAVVLSYSLVCRSASSRVYAGMLVKGQYFFVMARLGMSLLLHRTAPVMVW